MLGFRTHALDIFLPSFIKQIPVIFKQGQAPTVNAAQGCPQVMLDRIREGFQFLVGSFELRCTFDHTLFQLFI